MSLRDGFFVTPAGLVYGLINGSAYLTEPWDKDDPLGKLKPGYYDLDLNPVPEEIALAPDVEGAS
jgi:hypothetical protein